MTDRMVGIPENEGLNVSAGMHNQVVRDFSERIAGLRQTLDQDLIYIRKIEDSITKLEELFDAAPHDTDCESPDYGCTCWKADYKKVKEER